jgi:DNA processing protein
LAIGVDSHAHSTTLQNEGNTIAVLGSGVDNCTPKSNALLYNKIIESGGAIVSEMLPGQEPTKGSFPSRNRIIAGLSVGVVVTEGTEDSGALITANDAFASNRKVFAIPGPITSSYSKGPNSLLAKGAIPVTSASVILNSLAVPTKPKTKKIQTKDPQERLIINHLQNGQAHIDELIKHLKISPSQINTILSLMEMKGLIRGTRTGIFALEEIE